MRVLVSVLILFAAASVAMAGDTVSIVAENQPLTGAIDAIREVADRDILVDPSARGQRLSIMLVDVPWEEALRRVAKEAGCRLEEEPDLIRVVRQVLVSFSCQDADVRKVLSVIAAYAGVNIAFGPEVKGKTALKLSQVPWQDALRVAVEPLGFTVVKQRNGIHWIAHPGRVSEGSPRIPTIEEIVSLDVTDCPLSDAVALVREKARVKIRIDPRIGDRSVTLRVRRLNWDRILELLGEQADFTVLLDAADQVKLERTPRVSFDFQDADVRKILAVIAAYSKASLIIDERVQGKVTLRVNQLPFRDVLDVLARMHGQLWAEIDGVHWMGDPLRVRAEFVTATPALAPLAGDQVTDYVVDVKNMEIGLIAATIADHGGLSLEWEPGLDQKVTAIIRGLPYRVAIRSLARYAGLEMTETSPGKLVVKPAR